MESDVSYIFGSVSRRRQAEDMTGVKMSLEHVPSDTQQTRNARMVKEVEDKSFVCNFCKRHFTEPRVLPCLHTFCTSCLHKLGNFTEGLNQDSSARNDKIKGKSDCKPDPCHNDAKVETGGSIHSMQTDCSGGSGYESESHSNSGSGTPKQVIGKNASLVVCPLCGTENKLPQGGILALPPDYILQHRMILKSLNQETTRLLCDLCSTDIPASSRCTNCLLSLCTFCAEAHQRQRVTSNHEVLVLNEARQRGITQVRRQTMCPSHPELELQLFCSQCGQVICRECCLLIHRGHTYDTTTKAARMYTHSIRDSLERAHPLVEEAVVSLDRLRHQGHRIQVRCSEVQEEIDQFINSYISALEEHRRALHLQVQETRKVKLHILHTQQKELEKHAEDIRNAVSFAEDLLSEASDIEFLSLVLPVLHRLERCTTAIGSSGANSILQPRVSECLQFLPSASAEKCKNYSVYGVLTTQTISLQHCTLDTTYLMDVRQHQTVQTVLVTRDMDKQPLCHGGEMVNAEARYRDTSRRKIPVQVTDRRDGTYLISFMPDTSGNLNLYVSIQGKQIVGSPFHICVCTMRPHQGTFHCCSFCSSGGNKEATCGCGGKMPGGYKGCGHGHVGHPGRRHWSCCGNILQSSECGHSNSPVPVYQFTL